MAIVKVGTYRNPPEDITDYEAIVSHLNAYTRQLGSQSMILTEWTNTSGTPAIALGSYISHGGVLYVAESEEAVSLPVSDGTYYLKVVASGDTLALSWVSDISGYAWNAVYNGLYHADESQVLGYQLVVAGAVVEKWRITNLMQGGGFSRVRYDGAVKCESLSVAGAISGASLNTGYGALTFDQDVKKTASPTFASLHIDTDYLSSFSNLSAGSIAPPYNSVFTVGTSLSTSYTSVASFSLASNIVKSVDLSSNGVTGCRLTFLKLGASGAVATQVRILVDGVQVYESVMSYVEGGEAISFDVSCTPGQTIDIQKRNASAGTSQGTTGSISVSRTYTNAEKINEYLYNQIA